MSVGNECKMGVMTSVFESQDEACGSELRQPSQEKARFGSPVSLHYNHTRFLTSFDLVVRVCV